MRERQGGSTSDRRVSATLPYWVKVARSGSNFSSSVSSDGVNWVPLGRASDQHGAETCMWVGCEQREQLRSATPPLTMFRSIRQRCRSPVIPGSLPPPD